MTKSFSFRRGMSRFVLAVILVMVSREPIAVAGYAASILQSPIKPGFTRYDSDLYSLQVPPGWRHGSSPNYKATYFRKFVNNRQEANIGIVLWVIPAGFVPQKTADDLKRQVAGVWKSSSVNHGTVIIAGTTVDAITPSTTDAHGVIKYYMTLTEQNWVMGVDVVERDRSDQAEIRSILKDMIIKHSQIKPYAIIDVSVSPRS